MKFRVEEAQGLPVAIFEDEQPPRSWLLSTFLEEARTGVQDFLDEIERVRSGEAARAGFTCNGIGVELYPDHVLIEELYPAGGDDSEPERIKVPLDQARQLLLDWQVALEGWRPRGITQA